MTRDEHTALYFRLFTEIGIIAQCLGGSRRALFHFGPARAPRPAKALA